MSLNVGLSGTGAIRDSDFGGGLSLENDGYYWFLCPFFERIRQQTGQMVDLYGDAVFTGDQLPLLRAALEEAMADVKRRPPEWDEEIGRRDGTPVLVTIHRSEAQQRLSVLIRLTEEAHRTGKCVVFWGD